MDKTCPAGSRRRGIFYPHPTVSVSVGAAGRRSIARDQLTA
ncbi:hypothetical protein C4K37_0607 [Pseudomonas chlororaphis subsp. piscium]|nr:hypothetical protein C4K37_0607 [Pseudomonas chlororaphis subsp. piscium]AZC41561.1 hypothetical protein C4K36_0609 [Pseudomonas chlororaphis subsp. piscium]AZC48231.1 hypothetical protein C4K35_0621 [Pseudomonas chlororaphis subsp. piscium]